MRNTLTNMKQDRLQNRASIMRLTSIAMRYYFALIPLVITGLLSGCSTETAYFPKRAEHYYPKYLQAMNESSLYAQHSHAVTEQYRFLCLPSFQKPFAIRVQKDASGAWLRVVRLSGMDGQSDHIDYDKTFMISSIEWDRFRVLLAKTSFWNMPSREKNDPAGFDGSQEILEGRVGDKYHVVDRWTPQAATEERHLTEFVACGQLLLQLSKLEADKK